MSKTTFIAAFLVLLILISNGCGITSTYTDKVSGSGSLKKEYHSSNEQGDYAQVSVEVKDAADFEYNHSTFSNETRSSASENLIAKDARRIICRGEAKNNNNGSAYISISIDNGSTNYSNYVGASYDGIQAIHDMRNASGDNINISTSAYDGGGKGIFGQISAKNCEQLHVSQKSEIGRTLYIFTNISAVSGPLQADSFTREGDCKQSANFSMGAGVVFVDQMMNRSGALQASRGMIGLATLDTFYENGADNISSTHATVGSGNLIDVKQYASAKNSSSRIEYEYMPVSYVTGVYDQAYAEGEALLRSGAGSKEWDLGSKVLAPNCEHFVGTQEVEKGSNILASTNLNAIASPLKAASYASIEGRELSATANVAAGIINLSQSVDGFSAYQGALGMVGGCDFALTTENADGNVMQSLLRTGSGNLISMKQNASLQGVGYKAEYEYMPVSYQTGTYDSIFFDVDAKSMDVKGVSIGASSKAKECDGIAEELFIKDGLDKEISRTIWARATGGSLSWSSFANNVTNHPDCQYRDWFNGTITLSNGFIQSMNSSNATSCNPLISGLPVPWVKRATIFQDQAINSSWSRTWEMDKNGDYSIANELRPLQGDIKLNEILSIE